MKDLHCEKHPKYKGKKLPKYECEVCASIYFTLNNPDKPRMLPKPTKVFKDKSKYTRKKKHKKKESND